MRLPARRQAAIGTENPEGNRLATGGGLYDRHDLYEKARLVFLIMGFNLFLTPLGRNYLFFILKLIIIEKQDVYSKIYVAVHML